MKKRTPKQYADALYEITRDLADSDLKDAIVPFVSLLAKDRKFSKVSQIIELFEKKIKKEEGVVEIDVATARKMTEELRGGIEKVFGGKVDMTTAVDKELLGGIVVETEDTILDASVRTQLKRLESKLA